MVLQNSFMENKVSNEHTLLEKRKGSTLNTIVPAKRKRKKNNEQKKIKPPKTNEINRLRETENLFHSNLFRMQIEEMLKEIKIKDESYENLNSWFKKLKDFLLNIDFCLNTQLSKKVNIPNVVLPIKNKPKCNDSVFNFIKPKSIEIFGSFNTQCILKCCPDIDIVIEMPKEIFLKEDYLNEKYLRKRTYYLSCIASKLQGFSEINKDIKFVIKNSYDKPLLLVKPRSEKLRKYNFYIDVIPENGSFKEERFLPIRNNIRYGWFFGTTGDGKLNYSTPNYNATICHDLVTLKNEEQRKECFNVNSHFKDALLLLKVWLRQRNLSMGLGSFNGYLMAMFIVYLYKKRILNRFMSSYQVIRNVWVALDASNWHVCGISLENVNSDLESIRTFQSAYELVFIDVSGNVNLASNLSLSTYLQVKNESKLAVKYLDSQKSNLFSALFMTPKLILHQFDHLLYFHKPSVFKNVIKNQADIQTQLDVRHFTPLQFARIVISMLQKSLNKRIDQIYYKIEPLMLEWLINEKQPRYQNITIGIKMDTEHSLSIIDRGPVANLPEASEFRKFWGNKSELRRFKDGSVCEAVCWADSKDPVQKKRVIMRDITKFILEDKLKIKNHFIYVADQLELLFYSHLNKVFNFNGTGEECSLNVITEFNSLTKELRELKNLPFDIVSAQGSSAVFRYSDPFPILPNMQSRIKKGLNISSNENVILFDLKSSSKHMPLYVAPIEAVILFSASNKWPIDLYAIRRLQAAFYIKLSNVLKKKYDYICQSYGTHIDILRNGYIFRFKIYCNAEVTALKRSVTDDGFVDYVDNTESLYLERTLLQAPAVTSAMHALHQQFPAFGTACSITKRWLRCQLIDEYYFSDVCVDLLMSYLFINPEPYTPNHQPQSMFIRFLKFLTTNQWLLEPIILNFNDELSKEDIVQINREFDSNRSNLPPLFIVTPFDKSGSVWTRNEPSFIVLNRIVKLAGATLNTIEFSLFRNDVESLQKIIHPPLKGYDILIWTKTSVNPLRWLTMDEDTDNFELLKTTPVFEKLPVLNFHPIRSYVDELRKHYSEICLFFYNFYGGNVIGVVCKPTMHQIKEFKISNMKCSVARNNQLAVDIDILINDFYILGKDIVSYVEKCKVN